MNCLTFSVPTHVVSQRGIFGTSVNNALQVRIHCVRDSRGRPVFDVNNRDRQVFRRHPVFQARFESDPYKVLGVGRDADDVTIKKAYRRAALRSHPDVSKAPDAKERFLEIQSAYAILSDRSKRMAYDLESAGGRNSSDFRAGRDSDNFSGASRTSGVSGFREAVEYAKRWREKNPMPEDIGDSFGDIFSDLFAGISDVVSDVKSKTSPSILDDFVEFLEDQVGAGIGTRTGYEGESTGYNRDGGSSDEELDEILATGSMDVLSSELDDTVFLLTQLRARESRLKADAALFEERADLWTLRSKRPELLVDDDSFDEAVGGERELRDEAKRIRLRLEKVRRHIATQEKRESLIQNALKKVGKQQSRGYSQSTNKPNVRTVRDPDSQRREVDDELEKLRREMGL